MRHQGWSLGSDQDSIIIWVGLNKNKNKNFQDFKKLIIGWSQPPLHGGWFGMMPNPKKFINKCGNKIKVKIK
jgi:hypothetical protein